MQNTALVRRLALGGAATALLVAGGTGVALATTGGGPVDAGYGVVVDSTATTATDCPWSTGTAPTDPTTTAAAAAGDTR